MNWNQKVYVCNHVLKDMHDVLLVAREDNAWMFLCGAVHPDDPAVFKAVALGQLLERDPTLKQLLDLEDNSEAERAAPGQDWIRTNLLAN